MKTLYIIGNGFDIFHGIKTRYQDLHKYILKNKPEFETMIEDHFDMSTNEDYLWTNFEANLATFKHLDFYKEINNLDVLDDKFKLSMTYSLEEEIVETTTTFVADIKNTFATWLEDIEIENIPKKLTFNFNSLFITFNYTYLLEKTYQIPEKKILHIHGDIINKQNPIILGHNKILKEEPELDENGDSNRTIFTDSENAAKHPFYAFFKPVDDIITENKKLFESLSTIENVIIIGHSLNQIDMPYFKEIKKHISKNSNWLVTYHEEEDEKNHKNSLINLGINEKFISLEKM